ncbi:deoxyhypusine hydroxylase [Centruroides vittatus]|uniref:deoxyhypusine hydroxylase n=1 Tax=Centruroides vittatus TaxID=120091 RepID=UPI00350E9863
MADIVVDSDRIKSIGDVLNNVNVPLKARFRALFTLRNLGGKGAIDQIAKCLLQDQSVLLKHECAYCLGQMQDKYAIPVLVKVLENTSEAPMTRHEAGEALGAIGCTQTKEILKKYTSDPVKEVAETCQLALGRIEWKNRDSHETLMPNPFQSVDPAPPHPHTDVSGLKDILLDENKSLFERYRAMFTLRNLGTDDAISALGEGLKCESALFRHEIAFVLGQIQSTLSVGCLTEALENNRENEMVRHECAEALGSIATLECLEILRRYLQDEKRVVRESCEVALDILDYANSAEFQYANALKLQA